ncbi:hypothetical protein RB653_006680 [Dictyostelium firmibasis]|uniref:Mitochondrial import inner membrane translocase subunit TIM50 n=1 Tax=Dictyostelium firmibasis TaxID=79012 RepID=A0AAN7TTF3_9MYCE
MILNKVARCYGKQIGFFSNGRIQITKQNQSLYLVGTKRFFTTQQQPPQTPKQEEPNSKQKNTEDKKTEENEKENEDEEKPQEEEPKKSKYSLPPAVTAVTSTFFLGVIVASTFGYITYNFKKDISEEERYRLNSIESAVYEKIAEPFREFFDNIFENLRTKYEFFDMLFGPGKIHKIIPPPLPGGKKYTLVIDIDALTEITKTSKYPTLYKRAGLDFFLENLRKDYEIYLYFNANIPQNKIEQLNFKIDTNGKYFTGLLYPETGLKERNQFTKKLEMLDRDPSKVIFIDAASPYQHPNVINIGKFKSNSKDRLLVELLPILENFTKKNIEDVRPEIAQFQDIQNKSLSKMLEDYTSTKGINHRQKK